MQLHGQFHRDKKGVENGVSSWQWVRSGDVKRERENLVAAQDQAINNNSVKKDIYHTNAT